MSLPSDKRALRRQGYAARRMANQPETSRIACENLLGMPEYHAANTVLWYLSTRAELQTRQTIERELGSSRTIVIPWVSGNDLRLWRLAGFDELETGAYGILEPRVRLREDSSHHVQPAELDLVVVPGVGFDAQGHRIGNGHGYYDRFLARLDASTVRIGLCFEAQRFESVPHEPHDRAVDKLVTEAGVWSSGTLTSPVDTHRG